VNASREPDLELRLEKTRAQVAKHASGIRRAAWLTLLIGFLLLGLLSAYFYYGYTQFADITEPERIAGFVQTQVDDNLPTMRKSVEDEIAKSAPVMAEKVSTQIRENIPTARRKLEEYIIDQMKNTLAQGSAQTSDKIASFLRTNKDALRADAKELAKSPALAESSIAALEKAVENEIGGDLKGQSKELLAALNSTNDVVQKLAKGNNLNKTEMIERRVLQIARRLQLEQVNPSEATRLSPPAAQPTPPVGASLKRVNDRGPDPASKAAAPASDSKKASGANPDTASKPAVPGADSKKASERGPDPAAKTAVPATDSKKN
jgi:hypothetical protein